MYGISSRPPAWRPRSHPAKEAFYKCYRPLSGAWLEFQDVAINPIEHARPFAGAVAFTGYFTIRFPHADLPLAAEAPSFFGRYLVTDDLVVTSAAARFS